MKKIALLIWVLFINGILLNAQNSNPEFDPVKQPVAIRTDTGLILNTVSDYILIKSLKAQVPKIGRITGVECVSDGRNHYLKYRLVPSGKAQVAQFVIVPLEIKNNDQFFVNSSGNGYTCVGTCGCGQSTGQRCGCCSEVPPPSGTNMITLKKVSYAVETFPND